MKQIFVTVSFFVFMYLVTAMYANAQEGYGTYYAGPGDGPELAVQQLQQQQQQLQNQLQQQQDMQNQQDLQRTLNSPNQRCFYTGGRQFCN